MLGGIDKGQVLFTPTERDTLIFLDVEYKPDNSNNHQSPVQVSAVVVKDNTVVHILDIAIVGKSIRHTKHKHLIEVTSIKDMYLHLEYFISLYDGRRVWIGQNIYKDIVSLNERKILIPLTSLVDVICDLNKYWDGSLHDNVDALSTGINPITVCQRITKTKNTFVKHNALYDSVLSIIAMYSIWSTFDLSELHNGETFSTLLYNTYEKAKEHISQLDAEYLPIISDCMVRKINEIPDKDILNVPCNLPTEISDEIQTLLRKYLTANISHTTLYNYINLLTNDNLIDINNAGYSVTQLNGEKQCTQQYKVTDLYNLIHYILYKQIVYTHDKPFEVTRDMYVDVYDKRFANPHVSSKVIKENRISLCNSLLNDTETIPSIKDNIIQFIKILNLDEYFEDVTMLKNAIKGWLQMELSSIKGQIRFDINLLKQYREDIIYSLRVVLQEKYSFEYFINMIQDNHGCVKSYNKDYAIVELYVKEVSKVYKYVSCKSLSRILFKANILSNKEGYCFNLDTYHDMLDNVLFYGNDVYEIRLS